MVTIKGGGELLLNICRQVHRQFMRNVSARFYHHRTRKCIPPRKLRRDIQ